MPGIADPGERLVRGRRRRRACRSRSCPGRRRRSPRSWPSGLPDRPLRVRGLPAPQGSRPAPSGSPSWPASGARSCSTSRRTALARTLADLAAALGAERRVAVGRELTKLHEEVRRSTLAEAAAWAAAKEPLGEFVLVVDGAPEPAAATDADVESAVAAALAGGLSPRDAAARVAAHARRPEAGGLRTRPSPSAGAPPPVAFAGMDDGLYDEATSRRIDGRPRQRVVRRAPLGARAAGSGALLHRRRSRPPAGLRSAGRGRDPPRRRRLRRTRPRPAGHLRLRPRVGRPLPGPRPALAAEVPLAPNWRQQCGP